ncbi:unnamed protein product, partial [Leptidea sinapis]
MPLEERKQIVMKAYERLKVSLDKFLRPDGSKDAPGKTCGDIKYHHPLLPSDQYWIDPNGGDSNDAILVHCDMTNGASCVFPKPMESKDITYHGRNEAWLSEIEDGFSISYKADHSQLTYLQLLSVAAVQNVTLHCRNTVGYYDPGAKNYKRGLKLLAFNDAEILPKANNRLRYKALLDEC